MAVPTPPGVSVPSRRPDYCSEPTLLATPNRSVKSSAINGRKRSHSQSNTPSAAGGPRMVYLDDDEEDDDGPSKFASSSKLPKIASPVFAPRNVNGKAKGKAKAQKNALLEQRKELPIWKGKESLKRAVKRNDTIVILGETGSGKTTQVPQFLLEAGFGDSGIIGCTQPRRVAAISLANRVAAETGCTLGQKVGYTVRFDDKSGSDTRIKYVTDGMLYRELLSDRLLSDYSVIIIDEAHERTLRTDLLLSSLKGIQKERNGTAYSMTNGAHGGKGKAPDHTPGPLKLIIMSATLDAERFSRFFNNAKTYYVQGRQHPVEIYYTQDVQDDFVEASLRTLVQVHTEQPPGDVLVFLPGQEQIDSLKQSIEFHSKQLPEGKKVQVLPLYAALDQNLQNRVFLPAPKDTRKIILATNIAETSITIPGIKYVIDTGMCKEKGFITASHKGGGVDALVPTPISKSSAQQRAGRAGREGPGICYRLYTHESFQKLRESALPEIQRCNITFAVLQMKYLGQDPVENDYMDRPQLDTIRSAMIILHGLEALDDKGQLSAIGRQMASIPLDPPDSRALLASKDHTCTAETIIILSLLSTSGPVLKDPSGEELRESAKEARNKFRHPSGDHITLLNIYRTYEEILYGSRSSTDDREKGQPTKNAQHAARDWCNTHFVNERSLREAKEIAQQLGRICQGMGIDPRVSCGDEYDRVLKSILMGSFHKFAILTPEGTYLQNNDRLSVKIHPSSTLFQARAPAIVYHEINVTTGTYVRNVSSIRPEWLSTLPSLCRRSA